MSIRKIGFIISLPFFVIIAAGCSSVKETTSSWTTNEIKIDGNIMDWQGQLNAVPDKKFAVGFKNDNNFLYISLITDDRMKIMQLFRNGFITWLIPDGNDDKKFGIKFPLSNKELNLPQPQGMNREIMPIENNENIIVKLLNDQKEFEIINKDKFPLNLFSLENAEGIKLGLAYKANNFVYELQIPLASSKYQTKINSLPGGKLNIYFETEKPEFENTIGKRPESGGMLGGNAQMPGGGRRGGGSAGQMRQGFSKPEPIDYSCTVILQKQPN